MFTAARGAKALIDAGFTSAYGASEAKLRLAVAVRDEVNAGRIPGPRIRAGGLEISVTGAMGDESKEHNPRIGPATIVDGVEEMRRAVRLHCREGVRQHQARCLGRPVLPRHPGAHHADDVRGNPRRGRDRACLRPQDQRAHPLDRRLQVLPARRGRRPVPLRIRRRGAARHVRGSQGPLLRRADGRPVPPDHEGRGFGVRPHPRGRRLHEHPRAARELGQDP